MSTIYSTLLSVHIVAGVVGLVIAWPTLFVPKRKGAHVILGRVYGLAVLIMTTTALGLVAYAPARLWGLGIIAVGTLASAAGGVWLARRKPRLGRRGWYVWHLNLMSGSVISFVTAFAVTMTDGHALAWIVPTLIGSPLIGYRTSIALGQRSGGALNWLSFSSRR